MEKTWIFRFIILLSICHHSYSHDKQEARNGPQNLNNEKKEPKNDNNQPISNQEGITVATPRRYRHDVQLSSKQEHKSRKEIVWRFELDLPEVLRTLKKVTGVSISDAKQRKDRFSSGLLDQNDVPRTRDGSFLSQKIRVEMRPPNIAEVLGYMNNLFGMDPSRRYHRVYYGYVEEGPGAVKSPTVDYPPNFEEGLLNKLLAIQKKRDAKKG